MCSYCRFEFKAYFILGEQPGELHKNRPINNFSTDFHKQFTGQYSAQQVDENENQKGLQSFSKSVIIIVINVVIIMQNNL
jgi:hypothetical protein